MNILTNNFTKAFSVVLLLVALISCASNGVRDKDYTPELYLELPADKYNSTNGGIVTDDGTLIFVVPNINNIYFAQQGIEPLPAFISGYKDGNFFSWYDFSEEDLHPDTGIVYPIDAILGSDGNLYVADIQAFSSPENKGRILRINIDDDWNAIDLDVVVEGLVAPDGLEWYEDTLFVTDANVAPNTGDPFRSALYSFTLEQMSEGVVTVEPFKVDNPGTYVVASYESSGRFTFGADGIAADDEGNLYVGIAEDGLVYKVVLDENGKAVSNELFAQSEEIFTTDGIVFDPIDRVFYVLDIMGNGLFMMDLEGNLTLMHKNGDTDGANGELDQPTGLILNGDELIIANSDLAWFTDQSVNTTVDEPYTFSVVKLR